MTYAAWSGAVLSRKRPQLKWNALDPLEFGLVVVCGLLLAGFLLTELADVAFRILRRPWLEAQEFSLGFFVWGVFMGGAVGVRRNDHFRLAIEPCPKCFILRSNSNGASIEMALARHDAADG